jgi:hypothetical protein
MPPLTRRFLATAAAFLLTGVGLGFVMLVRRDLLAAWPSRDLISAHTHLILVGAMLETIIGTAWWFFPRPGRLDPAAPAWAAEAAWWLLTLGTALRAVAEATGMRGWLAVAGGAGQLLGIGAAVVALRRRVRPSRPLPQVGE